MISQKNTVLFAGTDATLSFNDIFELNFQYLYRSDSKIYPTDLALAPRNDLTTQGYLGEVIYSPGGDDTKWYALGMVNFIDSDFDPADYSSATIHAGYLLKRNVRLVAEYTWDFTNASKQYGRASVGFVSAF